MSQTTPDTLAHPTAPPRPAPEPRGTLGLISFCPVSNGIYAGMLGMNRALAGAGLPEWRLQRFRAVEALGRALGRYRINRNLVRLPGRACVVIMGWPNDGRAFPYGWFLETIPWICDCWPDDYPKWERLFRRNRTRLAFISSQGSVRHFTQRIPEMEAVWMPEACDAAEYLPGKPLAERSIQVLELGRKHKPFHDAVVGPLAAAGVRHIFAADGSRTPIFPDQPSLHRGLGDAAVSICFPKTVTHPDAAGGLETATLRYFESIASGCLLVGHCPAELQELFGFNPVIPADPADPAGHILSILRSIDLYQPFVDRARGRLLQVGTVECRAREMLRALRKRGWSVPA